MPPVESFKISDFVRELRQQSGLSQEKFAAKLGVSFKTVNRWENGRTVPSPLALKQLKELLRQMEHQSTRSVRDRTKERLAQYFQE